MTYKYTAPAHVSSYFWTHIFNCHLTFSSGDSNSSKTEILQLKLIKYPLESLPLSMLLPKHYLIT